MFSIEWFDAKTWKAMFAEYAHRTVFAEIRSPDYDRIDWGILVTRNRQLIGYATAREFDADTLYLQYGGAFPGTKETSVSLPAYLALIEDCRKKYKRITTLVENDNYVYLKFAMKAGFKIIGVRAYGSKVLLEHLHGEAL